jgi:adenylate cyclase
VPLGVGVHTGQSWFGAVGEGSHVELTALGDVVNTAARIASVATVGEILVTEEAAKAASLDPSLERTSLNLKGKTLETNVVTLRVD